MLTNSNIWHTTRRRMWQKYQHYRNIRVQMLLMERKSWPTALITRIEQELIPLIEADNYRGFREKLDELTMERIQGEYEL